MSGLTLYSPRDSTLHRLHPLTKLALAGAALVLGLTSPTAILTYLLVLLFILPLSALGQVTVSLIKATWPIVLPFAVSVFLIQGLFWQTGAILVDFGLLSLKTDGVHFAIASTGRILALVSAFLLLSFTTRPDELMIALDQRGLPPTLTYIVLATVQIVPRFQARARTITEAQQARGLETGGRLLQRIRAFLPLVIPLVLSSIVDVEQRAIALEARAFTRIGSKTSYRELQDRPAERWLRLSLVVIMFAAIVGRILLLFVR